MCECNLRVRFPFFLYLIKPKSKLHCSLNPSYKASWASESLLWNRTLLYRFSCHSTWHSISLSILTSSRLVASLSLSFPSCKEGLHTPFLWWLRISLELTCEKDPQKQTLILSFFSPLLVFCVLFSPSDCSFLHLCKQKLRLSWSQDPPDLSRHHRTQHRACRQTGV